MVTFAIYSFLGFVIESIYVSILERRIHFSGLLKGPFIPIYGFSALIILKTIPIHANNYEIFFYSMVLGSTLEYLTHFFLLNDTKIEIWNYQDFKDNFQGRICLFYSLMWGFLGIILVNYLNPAINYLIIHLNYQLVNLVSLVYVLIITYQFYHHSFQH